MSVSTKDHDKCQSVDEKSESIKTAKEQLTSKDLLRLENENVQIPNLLKENSKPRPDIGPPSMSTVLSRARSFLPKMKEAQDVLQKRLEENPDDVNMENVENADRVIEMNLAYFEYSGESGSSESESDSEDSDDETTGKNKLIEEL